MRQTFVDGRASATTILPSRVSRCAQTVEGLGTGADVLHGAVEQKGLEAAAGGAVGQTEAGSELPDGEERRGGGEGFNGGEHLLVRDIGTGMGGAGMTCGEPGMRQAVHQLIRRAEENLTDMAAQE